MATRVLSTEDGDLATPALVTSRARVYKDVDLSFEPRPAGDVYKKTDAAAVKQAVKNCLMTTPGEKPFLPTFGAGLSSLLFDLLDADAEEDIPLLVETTIQNYEPRARVLETRTTPAPDYNTVGVRVTFQVVSTEEVISLQTTISRVR